MPPDLDVFAKLATGYLCVRWGFWCFLPRRFYVALLVTVVYAIGLAAVPLWHMAAALWSRDAALLFPGSVQYIQDMERLMLVEVSFLPACIAAEVGYWPLRRWSWSPMDSWPRYG